jgi:hypothetical protein
MVMKDSYGFEAKGMAREKERDFVAKHYSERERKNLKVLTLLGHEDYELKQIWDPLGVPRENITVVEGNKKPYQILQSANFGINLAPRQSIDDFVQNTNESFDVINLDYQGGFDYNKSEVIKEIAYSEILNKKGVLATWFSGRREQNLPYLGHQDLVTPRAISDVLEKNDLTKSLFDQKAYLNFLKYANKRFKKHKEGEIREDSISEEIVISFIHPLLNFEQNPLVEKLGLEEKYDKFLFNTDLYKQRNRTFMEAMKRNVSLKELGEEIGFGGFSEEKYEAFKRTRRKYIDNNFKGNPLSLEDKELLLEDLHYQGMFFLTDIIKSKIKGALGNSIDKTILDLLAIGITSQYTRPSFVKDKERFKYHSDKGTPMFVDFNLFERENSLKQFWKIRDKKIIFPKKHFLGNKIANNLEQFSNKRKRNLLIHWPDREYLKPQKGEQTVSKPQTKHLSKEEIYSMLKEGKTKEEILSIDPSKNPRIISAYQAHVTMNQQGIKKGRPKKSKLEEKTLVPTKEIVQEVEVNKDNLETNQGLTKKEAIEYLKVGFTPKEIYQEHPEDFTLHQLAAWKAWYVTMGKENVA